jgi:hypothetical protein
MPKPVRPKGLCVATDRYKPVEIALKPVRPKGLCVATDRYKPVEIALKPFIN